MSLIVKIAWRNIVRHKGKSIIIGSILFLGALLMTIGNGIISGMDYGLQKNIVSSFTGDIVIVSEKQESDNVFLEFMGKAVEPVTNYIDIRDALRSQEYIDKYIPVGKNMVMVLNEEGGAPGMVYVIGADMARYNEFFPNTMVPVEGKLSDSISGSVLVPSGARKEMFDYAGIWFKPQGVPLDSSHLPKEDGLDLKSITVKDSVVFMGFNNDNTTSDIRLGIRGIVKYKALNTILGHFVLMDIESYRTTLGYFSAADKSVAISKDEKNLLNLENEGLDNLFADGGMENTEEFESTVSEKETAVDSSDLQNKTVDIDAGVYNLVLIKLKKGENLEKSVAALNKLLKDKKLGARAISWKKAMGTVGSMAVLIKTALFTFVMFLFFVAIIIIVNTLSMAAIERTTEIGMMRAVGARKGFIRLMFVGETAMLSFVFGGAGIAAGSLIIKIISMLHFTSDNDMVQLLYGGDVFRPLITGPDIVLAVIQLALVTFIAVLYPMKVASSITPLDAISRD